MAKKQRFNVNIFDVIDTEARAYWLGFISADGSVDPKFYYVSLELAAKDTHHLERLKKFLDADYEIRQRTTNLGHESSTFKVGSVHFVKKVIEHGIVPNKTETRGFPNLEPSLYNHFIRGFFDGNGWISIKKGENADFGIIGSRNFLTRVQKILVDECGLNYTKLLNDKRCQYIDVVSLKYAGNKQCKKIYEYLYKDATVFLERKKEVWSFLDNYPFFNVKTHCDAGHSLSGDNLYLGSKGTLCCKTCRNTKQNIRRWSRKALKQIKVENYSDYVKSPHGSAFYF